MNRKQLSEKIANEFKSRYCPVEWVEWSLQMLNDNDAVVRELCDYCVSGGYILTYATLLELSRIKSNGRDDWDWGDIPQHLRK